MNGVGQLVIINTLTRTRLSPPQRAKKFPGLNGFSRSRAYSRPLLGGAEDRLTWIRLLAHTATAGPESLCYAG